MTYTLLALHVQQFIRRVNEVNLKQDQGELNHKLWFNSGLTNWQVQCVIFGVETASPSGDLFHTFCQWIMVAWWHTTTRFLFHLLPIFYFFFEDAKLDASIAGFINVTKIKKLLMTELWVLASVVGPQVGDSRRISTKYFPSWTVWINQNIIIDCMRWICVSPLPGCNM